ncbi:MAG TPA: hypothetical protein VM347_14370 [Nonomuraea sp.]|nr:hypothetical protein [Nonomuraea sp.]
MRRWFLVLILIVLVGLWLLIGRPTSENQQAGRPNTSGAAPPTNIPTSAPTSVAAAQPTLRPTTPPTAAPTPTPVSRDVVTEVTEAELQDELTRMLVGKSLGTTPLGGATVQTVSVTLRNGRIRVAGDARAGFLSAPFTAAGTVTPDPAGRPKVQIEEATVGGVGLPEGTRAALADLLQTQVDGMFADPSLTVRSIDIADGKMRVVRTPAS